MSDLPAAHSVTPAADWSGTPDDRITLTYEGRFMRRKKLTTDQGIDVLVDLSETTSFNTGDVLTTVDGRTIEVVAAVEDLIEITGPDLVRLAWHIGNRHTPCQIEANRLLILHDHVISDMLTKIGATQRAVSEPFTPEGGAYGHGRTHSHAH